MMMVQMIMSTAAFLLLIMSSLVHVEGFASYLLSTSGCYVELDTSEVIMNHLVEKAVPDAPLQLKIVEASLPKEGDEMVVQVNGSVTTMEENEDTDFAVVSVSSFPVSMELQVVPSHAPGAADSPLIRSGYDFILQIHEESNASFENGSCGDHKRIAGQGPYSTVKLLIEEPNVYVWAGWAAGHEAVKLLRGLKFISADEEEEEL